MIRKDLTSAESQLIEAAFLSGALHIGKPYSVSQSPFSISVQTLMKNGYERSRVLTALREKYADALIHTPIFVGMTFEGIPAAVLLANEVEDSILYNMQMGSERLPEVENLEGKKVLLISGVVETGTRLTEVGQAVYNTNGICTDCLSLFSHDYSLAKMVFSGKKPASTGGRGGKATQLPQAERFIHGLINPTNILTFMQDNRVIKRVNEQDKTKDKTITFHDNDLRTVENWIKRNQDVLV